MELKLKNDESKWLSQYIIGEKIGEGTYGKVHKALYISKNKEVAIKVIKSNGEDGIPATTLREIVYMKKLQGVKYLIEMTDYKISRNKVYMVLEYIPYDLREFYKKKVLNSEEIKIIIFKIISGVNELHKKGIIHRDLKPQNVLISEDLKIKITDYGLARNISLPSRPYTKEILTQNYRPHEIILGSDEYIESVDIWSVGCIFVELFLRRPFFDGQTEFELCFKIFR